MLKNHWNTLKICLIGIIAKQPLSNFEPWITWKFKQLWGLRTTVYYIHIIYSCRKILQLYHRWKISLFSIIIFFGEETIINFSKLDLLVIFLFHFCCIDECRNLIFRSIHSFFYKHCVWVFFNFFEGGCSLNMIFLI